ncbi:MAG: DUF2461 domain-containing protein [Gemmatimonadetes bacterium]|nr:DUF2461 domain-containing protein [Gemmatimonadota bacterium]
MSDGPGHVTKELFAFLSDLADNNDRDWFQANRSRYEDAVREPLRAFIRDVETPLESISPHIVADDRKSGGSLFRIHRDTRFSKDKSPYKTWAALQFRHEAGKDAHAPGFYLHLEPGNIFMGGGCWHPAREALESIRDAIAEDPGPWFEARDAALAAGFEFEGESLKRPPRGYPADHPAIDDLKRKDFIAVRHLAEKAAFQADFVTAFAKMCSELEPLMRFLTSAIGVRW